MPEISASDLGIEGSVQTTSTNNEEVRILGNSGSPPVVSYHDDSDEDLLA